MIRSKFANFVLNSLGSFAQILKGQTIQPVEQADGHFSSDVSRCYCNEHFKSLNYYKLFSFSYAYTIIYTL